jgi:exodeoxyribonuclease-3
MGAARQVVKMRFLERVLPLFAAMHGERRSIVVCGDVNIAHREIDVFDARAARGVTGFLPSERSWLDDLFGPLGWTDAMRVVDPEPRRFTWWSKYPGQYERNNGWRIDYQIVTPDLAPLVRPAAIERDERFSDHAPLEIAYDFTM